MIRKIDAHLFSLDGEKVLLRLINPLGHVVWYEFAESGFEYNVDAEQRQEMETCFQAEQPDLSEGGSPCEAGPIRSS